MDNLFRYFCFFLGLSVLFFALLCFFVFSFFCLFFCSSLSSLVFFCFLLFPLFPSDLFHFSFFFCFFFVLLLALKHLAINATILKFVILLYCMVFHLSFFHWVVKLKTVILLICYVEDLKACWRVFHERFDEKVNKQQHLFLFFIMFCAWSKTTTYAVPAGVPQRISKNIKSWKLFVNRPWRLVPVWFNQNTGKLIIFQILFFQNTFVNYSLKMFLNYYYLKKF